MNTLVLLSNHFYPWKLEQAIADFLEFYNHQPYHDSLQNLTFEDFYFGREEEVLSRQEQIKLQIHTKQQAFHSKSLQMDNAR